jgi:beta-galactosidase/beta-glucuronidase
MAMINAFAGLLLSAGDSGAPPDAAVAQAPAAPLLTRWAADVDPQHVLPEYPRPGLVRERWLSLNGYWEYAIRPSGTQPPEAFDGRILVPFPLESTLSGVGQALSPTQTLHYRRNFSLPQDWRGGRLLLHFEAVDWKATLRVNGKLIGEHSGGYDPFSFDITDALRDGDEQQLELSVEDPSDSASQPRGKQVLNPGSIWYTATSGIWQSVWLEPVAMSYISGYTAQSDLPGAKLALTVNAAGAPGGLRVKVRVMQDGRCIAEQSGAAGETLQVPIADPVAWSPRNPFLYGLQLELVRGGLCIDSAAGYCGMRDVRLGRDAAGKVRILLNGVPEFQSGVLDQGFWPDGLYTAPTDAALKSDIETLKALGFNMLRKHVKVEPRRFYYWCDVLGIWVWQDMPSGFASALSPGEQSRPTESVASQFKLELERMIAEHINHPSIIVWVPFNESWGQHDTEGITQLIRRLDGTRLIDSASGWVDYGVGELQDLHNYPEPKVPPQEGQRALVLGEFGGLGLRVDGHMWTGQDWGYATPGSAEQLLAQYRSYYEQLWWMAGELGLCAAVYTQLTDVETEVNGLLTYDRAVVKMDEAALARINARRPDAELER